jgi:hypothetical protein
MASSGGILFIEFKAILKGVDENSRILLKSLLDKYLLPLAAAPSDRANTHRVPHAFFLGCHNPPDPYI